ncbi:serine hydrolase domain-containing protein [Actinomadura sp. 3N407]|uniref:serine hydrolase domain-containing protein n=1 Tax=Actinomadura sp. 3N407 TaxID=3457423 RepID=UPI003FCE7A02
MRANRCSRGVGTVAIAVAAMGTISACGDGRGRGGVDAALQHADRPAAATVHERTDPSVQSFLETTLPQGPGGTVVAARDGRLLHCRGFGMADQEKKIPARCDTAYDIMSMTKQFTAAAIMKLEMMGKLRVTDPISTFLGPVPADKQGITLHHLLAHTAGLNDDESGDDYDPVSRDGMLDVALKSRLQSAPGAAFHYSNLGYSVLAAIIEKVSGVGYERFLARHLFAPSGMARTGYVLPRWDRDQVAVEYDEHGRPQGRPHEHPWAADGPYWFLRGNGGLLSTPRDMFRWHRALEGNKVLSGRAKRKMFKPHVSVGVRHGHKVHYGYGWVVIRAGGRHIVEHDGGNDWSFGEFARFTDPRVMVFWITNHAYRQGKWNLHEQNTELTFGIEERARD